jgi:MFS family permease
LFDKDVNNYHLDAGRRIELVTAAALYILGALVTGFAPNFVALIIGRVLYGIGIGLVSICRYTDVFLFPFSRMVLGNCY